MVDEGRVARLLRGIDERTGRLAAERDAPHGRRDEPLWLDGVKYLFVTAIEGCVDVAHHVVASQRWDSPDTNAATFAVLAAHGVIDDDTSGRRPRRWGSATCSSTNTSPSTTRVSSLRSMT